ncbi:MAG: SIS domain-containing protein [Nitrospirae bacterium]|nr:SIS domain-containing protein [Nitrospirota bacterium]
MVTKIRVLALDIDGVITDGTASLSDNGDEDKRFSFQDLDAVTQAQRAGLPVAFVTAEDTPTVDRIMRRFKCDLVQRGAKDKLLALEALSRELNVHLDEFCYVGDGDRDAPALRRVGLGLAPLNATHLAKSAAHRVLSKPGGNGAVAETIGLLRQLHSSEENADVMEKSMYAIVTNSIEAHQRLLEHALPVLVRVAQAFVRTIRSGNKIVLFGNGGSAADAQHVAGELVGRFLQESEPWPVIALTTDSSILTAVGNDWDFAEVFSRQVRALAKPGDVVVGISTSGRSPNVIRGLQAGRAEGAMIVGFTGSGGNQMREHTDICFQAPSDSTPRIQELHLVAWHAICEMVERELLRTS